MRTRFDTTYDALRARLRTAGDLDLTTSEGLAAELEAISATGSTWVEPDLDEVTFVDAHSVRPLDLRSLTDAAMPDPRTSRSG